jgi:hypothetical protein
MPRPQLHSDPTEEEISRLCEEIQQDWSDATRELRRRGQHPTEPGLSEPPSPYTVPVVSERELMQQA